MSRSPRQTRLSESLSKHDISLGKMYLGGLHTFNDISNPDRIAQAAHSFRELMEKAPQYIGELQRKQRTGYSLMSEVRNLWETWTKMKERSRCFKSSSGWAGEIDPLLTDFLKYLCQFFTEVEENRPTRRQEFANLRQRMDPSKQALPESVESLITKEWAKLYGIFAKICHHRYSPELPEIERYIERLEGILTAVLVPQTVSDHERIKQQIAILEDND